MLRKIGFSVWLTFAVGFTQENPTPDSAKSNFQPNKNLEIAIPKLNSGIKLDGILDDDGWVKAARVGNFCETEPGDNCKPQVETEALMTYDESKIYFAFICYDTDMSKLRATLTDRDRMFSDDWVGVMVNTFADDKQAYELYANPFGIQGDLIWTPNDEDESFDMIWESQAKIYHDKWIMEMAVPFKSLRFPNSDEQKWKIHFIRTRPRESRQQLFWAPVSRDNPSLLSQAGFLTGIKNIKSGKNLEILPYAISSQAGYIITSIDTILNDTTQSFKNESIKGNAGVGIKYGITSNLTLDFSLNPDFSQVESDAGQIDVNTTFALFYPEKRPFFLEGNEIFRTPIDVVYTRSINDPLFAGKVTGKIGSLSVGYIVAYDEHTPFIIPFEEYSSPPLPTDKKSVSNILRLKKDLKGESYFGLIATNRETEDAYNRVYGLDANVRFLGNYNLLGQILGYSTKELNDTLLFKDTTLFFGDKNYTASFDGEKFSAVGGFIELNRNARHWNFNIHFADAPPEARRENGFLTQNDFRRLGFWQGYTMRPNNKLFVEITPMMFGGLRYRHVDGSFKEQWLGQELYLGFKKQISIYGNFLLVNDEKFKGVWHKNVRRGLVEINSNTSKILSGGFFLEMGRFIARDTNIVGNGHKFGLWTTFKPASQLVIENNYNYFKLSSLRGGKKLSLQYILRNKTAYQFSKNLFLRVITQYDSEDKIFNIDPLLSYKLNPFTIFYIGSTHDIQDYGSSP
ncbi:MAG TPA: DUF5916 domain-containing protein, partial [candidate division Zixibacteria bacterium]|nr:DUF5916 domain-containing protein [candidate division Zixibacteria bacterium]